MMRTLILSLIAAVTVAGCGSSSEATTDSTVPPAATTSTTTPPANYDNDQSKDDVGANGMPGGGPTTK